MGRTTWHLVLAVPALLLLAQTSPAQDRALPDEFDLRDLYGAAPPVKDQLYCGSCWAVATTSAVEWILLKDDNWAELGPQALVDCETNSYGCGGGFPSSALQYIETEGLPLEEDYPYTGEEGTCTSYNPYAKVTGSSTTYTRDDEAVMEYIWNTGHPVITTFEVYADFEDHGMWFYIYQHDGTAENRGSKAVQIIGWGTEGGVDYWICENTWGTEVGDYGYFRIKKGEAGIGEWAFFVDDAYVVGQEGNQPPFADAGPDQTVPEGALVTLDGSGSYDIDDDALTYVWQQTSGEVVGLDTTDPVNPVFTAPQVGQAGAALEFQLTVSDGVETAVDSVEVFVESTVLPPVADAGPDQAVTESDIVTLDGSGSFDPGGNPLTTYTWTQTGGPPVTLDTTDVIHPTFTAPAVNQETGFVFSLVVQFDGESGVFVSDPDSVRVSVSPVITNEVHFDLRDLYGTAPPVKHQLYCGSCWAVATTSAVEWILLKDDNWAELAPQALVDCETNSYGCNGGSPSSALQYIETEGLPLEEDYPYTGEDGTCASYIPYAKVTGSSTTYTRDDEAVMEYIWTTGHPVITTFDVCDDFPGIVRWSYIYQYVGNVDCLGSKAVLIIGWGTEGGVDYWICENTWGTQSGDFGYFRIKRGEVDIGTWAFFVDDAYVVGQEGNHPPVADAGPDQTVPEGSQVILDGSGSYDIDGDGLTLTWQQTGGEAVGLDATDPLHPVFTAPQVGQAGASLVFELTVSDGVEAATDTVEVLVENVNHPPEADAGPDQTVPEGTLVTLDGSGSRDPDGDALSFLWTQVGGPAVGLDEADPVHPAFVAPAINPAQDPVRFQLVVNDGIADSAPDEVVINVVNQGESPVCDLAWAHPDRLWPPNHRFVSIQIQGVTDPDGDAVTVAVNRVTQDEPVNGQGDGNTSPDAEFDGDQVSVRAERSGGGDGRVYHIWFDAADPDGRTCSGIVTVCVPHDRHAECVDGGPLFEATDLDGYHDLKAPAELRRLVVPEEPFVPQGCVTPGKTGPAPWIGLLALAFLLLRPRGY